MKTIRFTAYPDAYRCSEPGDQSGEYVHSDEYRLIRSLLRTSYEALRSYQSHNSSTDLAKAVADKIEASL